MDKKSIYLSQLNIAQYVPREAVAPMQVTIAQAETSASASTDWELLQEQVSHCQLCDLCKTRNNTVFGVGNPQADLMLIGEAPGATEDQRGEPFVGEAGQLLDKMLAAIQLSRQTVFIANILKCRPPNNRDPLPEEVAKCLPYLQRQIAHVKPKLILAVGRVAAQNLLNVTTPISKLRGQTFTFGENKTPMIATFHPAYLLRNPAEKRNAWVDLQRVQTMLQQL